MPKKRRPGGGRKKKAYTLLKERILNERLTDAWRAFDLLVQIMDNTDEPTPIRRDAANDVLDRILGRAREGLIVRIDKQNAQHVQFDLSGVPPHLQWLLSGLRSPASITAGSTDSVIEGELVRVQPDSPQEREQSIGDPVSDPPVVA